MSYYFNAWQLAADKGHCPNAENLVLDDDEASDHIEEERHFATRVFVRFRFLVARSSRISAQTTVQQRPADEPGSVQRRLRPELAVVAARVTCGG